jgi:hypothetical protein
MRIVLLGFPAAHSQDVALLEHRFDYRWGEVWWVPVKYSEWIVEGEIEWWGSCYFVLLQRIRKILRSLITDLIIGEVKCGEGLWKIVSEYLNVKSSDENRVTLFSRSAFARYCAPSKAIRLDARWSVVSVCENSEWIVECEIECWESSYFVLLQCSRNILRSLITDLIISEVKCGECLWNIVSE